MADNKKYYYLKLKDNFFDTDEMVVLESMPDGHLYSNILLKLYLRSLKNEGRLMFNDRIPFNSTILSQVTRHSVGVVEKALVIFRELGLIEVLDNGAIYLLDIQNFIGTSSTEADRKREYRARIAREKEGQGQMSATLEDKCPDKSPPEIEIELEIELERELETETGIDKSVVAVATPTSTTLKSKDIEAIINKWNQLNLQQLRSINKSTNRHKMLRARISEYGIDDVFKAIENIKRSTFLQGQNKKGWTITFDWLVRPNNFPKVLEGNYTDKKRMRGSHGATDKEDNKYDEGSRIAEQAGVQSF